MALETVELPRNVFNDLVNGALEKLCDPSKRIKINKKIIGNERQSLPAAVPAQSGIYTIWADDELMYIGEVGKTLKLTGRLKQHLIKCHEKTQSKLEQVKDASDKGRVISVSFIHVEPEPFRLALEDELIRRKTEIGQAPWNQKSASNGEMQKWVVDRVKNYAKELYEQMGFADAAKKKTGITKDVLSSAFVFKFGAAADYNSIIDSLLTKNKIVDNGNGYDIPKRKITRKKKRKPTKKEIEEYLNSLEVLYGPPSV